VPNPMTETFGPWEPSCVVFIEGVVL